MKRINSLLKVLLFVLLVISISMVAMAAQDKVVITGFEEDIEVSVAELKELPVITKTVVSVNSSGEESEYTITGALFSDLLEKYGKLQKDIKAIRLVAGDGYAIDVDENVLKNREIILGYLYNGQPIEERYQPVRVVIPEERAMYWVKNLVKIEIVDFVKTTQTNSIYFLETAVSEVEQTDYTYYESIDKAVNVTGLMAKLGLNNSSRAVGMVAADGFEKSEETAIFDNGYIKITGEYAPMFLSPDIPKGMYVKSLLFIQYGGSTVCSVQQALEVFEKTTLDDNTGIKISDLFKKSGLVSADKYLLKAVDGYSVEVTTADIKKGLIYLDEKGRIRSYFQGLPKNTSVKYLYSIEPVLQ